MSPPYAPETVDRELETSVLAHTMEYYSAINRNKAVRRAPMVRSADTMLKAGWEAEIEAWGLTGPA